jgi:hypothetical protein
MDGAAATGHLHKCDDVLVNFQNVTALAFVSTSVGLEHERHEVLAPALLVNLAVGNDILGELSDGVRDGTLGLKGLEREGGDPRKQPQNERGYKGRVFTAHLILSPPAVDDLDGIGSVTERIEVMTKSDTADDVHSGAAGIVDDVKLDERPAGGSNFVRNAGLESGGDVINVGVHRADIVNREGGGDESTHALMLPLTLDPEERAAGEADDEGTHNGRVSVIVRVLREDVRETNGIAHNQLDQLIGHHSQQGGGASADVLTMSGWPQAALILKARPHSLNQAHDCEPRSSSNSIFSWPQTREAPACEREETR